MEEADSVSTANNPLTKLAQVPGSKRVSFGIFMGLMYGAVVGALMGAATGSGLVPVLGTIFGGVFGAMGGAPVGLLVGLVVSLSIRASDVDLRAGIRHLSRVGAIVGFVSLAFVFVLVLAFGETGGNSNKGAALTFVGVLTLVAVVCGAYVAELVTRFLARRCVVTKEETSFKNWPRFVTPKWLVATAIAFVALYWIFYGLGTFQS